MIGQTIPATETATATQKSDTAPAPAKNEAVQGTVLPDLPQDSLPKEIGGRDGLEPTRYGDWEKNGRCIDF